jgi:hypothetical protein
MRAQALERELRETLVEPGVRPLRANLANTRARQAERQHAERHIDPVCTPKRLYQFGACAPKRPNLVMFANHAGDIVAPIGVT